MLPEQTLLRIATENAGIGLVVISRDRRYAYANSTYVAMLDLAHPAAKLVGQRVGDVLADVYELQVRPRLDRAFAGEQVGYDLHKMTNDGERLYAVRYEPTTVDGSVEFVVVVLTDITDRHRSEVGSSRFAAIVESSDDAIISKTLDGVITSWNGGAERIFGYSADEMVGGSIMRLIPEDRREEEMSILETIRRNERVKHLETVRRTKSGELIHVSVTTSPIKDPRGRVIGASKVARDITERKRADDEMRFQQAMLLTERELTLDGILAVDHQSRILSFNRRFAEMWGIPEDVLATRADTVLLQRVNGKLRDPDAFMRRVRELYDRHDEPSHDEVELTDGRIFDRYSAPMSDPSGAYYGRVWYFRDVTGARQAEVALRQARDRAQRYLDTADVILLALDVHGRVTGVNRKGCDLLGWSEAELIGKDWVEACLPIRHRRKARARFMSLIDGDMSIIETPILTKAGNERLIEWRNRLQRDDDGRVLGTLSSGTDITERHAAVEALRVAEERMRFALESADVGVWEMDYRTGVARMSGILERQYGLEPGTFGGTYEAFVDAVHPEDRDDVLQIVANAMKSGADFSTQHRALWPDGTVRWLSTAGRIHLDAYGQPERGLGISMDVTARRKLEEQFHQAQKMEAVGRLAGGVAHDFNNLLTGILGFAQLLLEDLDGRDPRRADVIEIQQAGESAARLTRQLLAFSRKQIIEPVVLNVNEVVRAMQGILQRVIGEDVNIVMSLRPDSAKIKADAGQLEQVVMNLAVNARDAMPNGGTLTIETANVELDESYASAHFSVTPGPHVALTVSDTGTGMSPEVQARVFEPFFTTKEPGKGTGLGLATVHGIVAQSGGSVSMYSEVGHGTSFTIYFPRSTATDADLRLATRHVRPRGGGEQVLVVEDEARLRELAKRMLERQGYSVLLAANANHAIDLFDENTSIAVVVTDVVMPGGSGPELVRQLMLKRPELKVIYVSGYTEEMITHHGMVEPGIVFLHKPFTSEMLGNKIREVLDR